MANADFNIIEKPDWVSWDDVHDVLVKAHAQNRANGINMRKPTLPGEKIAEEVGNEGKMFVALDGRRVVGTGAIVLKRKSYWCGGKQDCYACVFFDSVLPEYNGLGIFKRLDLRREKEASSMGIDKLLADTHENNQHRLQIAQKAGYKFVDYKFCGDHYNVVMVKWLNGCPYSDFRCWYEFHKRKLVLKAKTKIKSLIK